jgi:AraC-like DNA-binding protein
MSNLVRFLPKDKLRRKFRFSSRLIVQSSPHAPEGTTVRHETRESLALETPAVVATRNSHLPGGRLKRVLAFIDANLDQNITLAELARHTKMSVYYFATLFKGSTGLSPHRYILHQRVLRARELLRNTRLSVLEVSLNLGFERQNNFARAFRCITGMTPTRFRRTNAVKC